MKAIESISPMQKVIAQYNTKTGGVNVDKLRRLTDKPQPEEAVIVTISKEAKELAQRMEKK